MSTIVCQIESQLDDFLAGFDAVSKLFSGALAKARQIEEPVRLRQIHFSADPLNISPRYINSDFTIARRINHPFDEGRIISEAPLSTEAHMALIETIETELKHRSNASSP